MLAQAFTKKTLIVVLILAAALITLGFAVYSAPAASVKADRSYDAVEQLRIGNPAAAPIDTRYEAIQEWRAEKAGMNNGYDDVEALHAGRQFAADSSYDVIENLRLMRTLK